MKMRLLYIIILLLFFQMGYVSAQQMSVANIFTDDAVLQRNKKNKIWGKAQPEKTVKLTFDGRTYQTTAAADGSWLIETAVLKTGAPRTMTIISGEETLTLKNILVGDVWICSGQSNMEFSVGNFPWSKDEIATANNTQIHFYTLPNTVDCVPNSEIPKSNWKIAIGSDLSGLSAVAYFFAKNIQPQIGIPVGLIITDWSGIAIEPWMSMQSLEQFAAFDGELDKLKENTESKEEIQRNFEALRKNGWDSQYYLKGKGMDEKWYLPDTDFSDWKPIKFPNYWEDANVGLDNYDGAVWFKTSFDLPDNFKDSTFHIFLSYVKDYNIAWVNGHQIGETYGHKNWSDYYTAIKYLKPKNNILVVRVFNVEGKGGFNYHPFWSTDILNGNWVFKADFPIDSKTFPKPKIININPFGDPTVIYNAMIYPLLNYSLTGFIWYQGESNAGRGYEYRTLFPAMISGWRQDFKQGNLPFYFVQLANYEKIPENPENSDWAELRESQTYALKLPNTGMAVAIDIGETADIHPKNKQEVGRRLALQALAKTYKMEIECEPPQIQQVIFKNNKAIITVQSASPLKRVDAAQPIGGFAIAGKDSIFYWADDVLVKGNQIEVSSSKVDLAVAVRYAWSKDPGKLNLQNAAGLPLAPFRSDTWKGITDDRHFDPEIVYF